MTDFSVAFNNSSYHPEVTIFWRAFG